MIYKCHVTISIIANDDAHLWHERLEYTFLLLFPIRIKIVIFFRELYLPSIIFLIFIKYTNCTKTQKNYWYWYVWRSWSEIDVSRKKNNIRIRMKVEKGEMRKKRKCSPHERKKEERKCKFKRKISSLTHMYNRL